MAEQEASPLRTLYRSAVMLGTLACGAMAAYHYGPPPERLATLINSAAQHAGLAYADPIGEEAESATPADSVAQAAALFAGPPDDAIQLASLQEPMAGGSADANTQADAVIQPLLAAGAQRAEVRPIGAGADQVFQAIAVAPAELDSQDSVDQGLVGQGFGEQGFGEQGFGEQGLTVRLDALGDTPEEAVGRLVEKLSARRAQ
ncbi:hypothetical protein [Botrimarina sp.]|uniref:hypothetical protein n=1 Tax=Botrimarina sp. TaxID=2795802 RepID=UPI0032EF5F9E